MIVSLEGILERATPLSAIINVNGVGYLVHVPVTTAEKLPQAGQKVKLLTHAVYREDSQALYGFSRAEERDFFCLVIDKVSGVGPKVAISLLSKLPLPSLIAAISNEDANLLAKTPGIGKKTAQRLIVELKDKLSALGGSFSQAPSRPGAGHAEPPDHAQASDAFGDAIKALEALGFRFADAQKAIANAQKKLGADATTEALIKAALG